MPLTTTGITCKVCRKPVTREEIRLDARGHIREKICRPCSARKIVAVKASLNKGYPPRYKYRKYKVDQCVLCGFKGHVCQLDVDHIDGNHNNDAPENLQTLCANCHRLKTYQQRWS